MSRRHSKNFHMHTQTKEHTVSNAKRSAKTPSTRTGAFATLARLLRARGSGASLPRCLALALALSLAALCALAAAGASAATVWNLETHHNPTNFASSLPGSVEVATVTQGSPTQNEVQKVTLHAEAGKFTLEFEGAQTAALEYSVGKVPLRTALRGLPTINGPNVEVEREAAASTISFFVTFQGALAHTDVPQLVAAQGAPPLTLTTHDQYWFDLNNVGSTASAGPISLTVNLPAGVTSQAVIVGSEQINDLSPTWSCTGESGAATVHCETTSQIPRHMRAYLVLEVALAPGAEGPLTATATLSGGGAASPSGDSETAEVSSAPAPFGIFADSFTPDFFGPEGTLGAPQRTAGGRPDFLIVPVDFNTVATPTAQKPNITRAAGSLRDLRTDLPPGFLGNPTAVGECTAVQFAVNQCPPDSQVGRFDGAVYPMTTGIAWRFSSGVFNMADPPGVLTDLGFDVAANPVHVKASLDPARGYAITTEIPNLNETVPPYSGKVTIWGLPADQSHDSERCHDFADGSGGVVKTTEECSAEHPVQPFLTMPFRCTAPSAFDVSEYDSWQESGLPNSNPEISYTLPGPMEGCGEVPFDPSVSVAPTTDAAESPSGLDVEVDLPQHEQCTPISPAPTEEEEEKPHYECETATSPLRDATVALPQGITVNPASANGLAACAPAQISLGTDEPVTCPSGSQVASVEVTTPALPDPVEGVVYLATPYRNPFASLLAGYIVLEEPSRGLLVKLPGQDRRRPRHRAAHRQLRRKPPAALLQARTALQGRRPLDPDHPADLRHLHLPGRPQPLVGDRRRQAGLELRDHEVGLRGGLRLPAQLALPRRRHGAAARRPLQPLHPRPLPRRRHPALLLGDDLPAAGPDREAGRHRDLPRLGPRRRRSEVGQGRAIESLLPRRLADRHRLRRRRRRPGPLLGPGRRLPDRPLQGRPALAWRSSPRRWPVPSTSAPSSSAPPSTSTPRPPASPRYRTLCPPR